MDRLLLPRGLRLRRRHAAARPRAQDDTERRVLINTIGPVWDGNEVWLLVAGGATFAAFPEWYATLFSGFYLPLLLILVALIVRGLAFEYRAKRDDDHVAAQLGPRHRSSGRSCRRCCGASRSPTSCAGVPIDADLEYVGGFFNLLNPYALLGGADDAAAVPHPRRDVHRAQDRRPDPRRGARRSPCGSAPVAAVVAVALPALDPDRDRHRGLGRRLRLVARSRCSPAWSRDPRGREGWALPRHLRRHRASAWRACSWRCSRTSCPPRSPTASRLTTTNASATHVHADDHDRGGGDLHAGRARSTRAGPTGSSASGSPCTTSRSRQATASGTPAGTMRPTDPWLRQQLAPARRQLLARRGGRRRRLRSW